IFMIDGLKGIKETLPSILVVSVTYTLLQVIMTSFAGPELADIIPGLAAMVALALFSSKFQPQNIFRLQKDEEPKHVTKHSFQKIVYA
ncbi:L-lactate permease, partial [Staphylococcus hominis]